MKRSNILVDSGAKILSLLRAAVLLMVNYNLVIVKVMIWRYNKHYD